jgi:hypothetical protein
MFSTNDRPDRSIQSIRMTSSYSLFLRNRM